MPGTSGNATRSRAVTRPARQVTKRIFNGGGYGLVTIKWRVLRYAPPASRPGGPPGPASPHRAEGPRPMTPHTADPVGYGVDPTASMTDATPAAHTARPTTYPTHPP